MKKLSLLFVAAMLLLSGCSTKPLGTPLKAVSFNVRMSQGNDGENVWANRRHATQNMFEAQKPDVVGVQEALLDQIQYIDSVAVGYERIGVGRDDGAEAGEFLAIYYNATRLELLDWGTLWLSETPNEVSRGWDAACNRTMTWAKFRDMTDSREFYFFNTHFDHQGGRAREESAKFVVEKIGEIANDAPAVLVGDFNTTAESRIFRPINDELNSARNLSPTTDEKGTFNSFGTAPDTILIDHIYYTDGVMPNCFVTLTQNFGAPYISDHYPIEFVFQLK